jgi:DUF2075 family protein
VLLTRGWRGCYVHFLDPQTRVFVLSRLERPARVELRAAEVRADYPE